MWMTRSLLMLMLSISAKALIRVPRAQKSNGLVLHQQSRSDLLQLVSQLATGALVMAICPVQADDVLPPNTRKILACQRREGRSPSNCISTSSVNQVDCYVAPWTFDCTLAEAQGKLKDVFRSDPLTYTDIYEELGYIRVNAVRGLVTDELEFVFDEGEHLVKLRSAELSESPSVSDFGANRRRMDSIRRDAKVFEVMGGSFDAIENRGTGPVGQLKAFYGLQSGAGYESLYED